MKTYVKELLKKKEWTFFTLTCPECLIPFYALSGYKESIYCPYCKLEQKYV